MPELHYTCPYCETAGFTHRGLTAHICRSAPGASRRALTKTEIAKIVVKSSLPPTTPTPKP